MARIDPRELVKEDETNVLACPQTKMPVDLEKLESQFLEFHQFLRVKAYDFQDKYEKTLVYLSSGAIVLTYSFLGQTASANALAALLFAIGAWGITCILSLITIIVHIGHSVGALNSTGIAFVSSKAYQFWTKNLKELYKVSKLADNKFLFFKDENGNDVKNGAEEFKESIGKIASELEAEKDRLQESINLSYTSNTSDWWWNTILLLFFIIGCVAFAVFTRFQYWK